MTPGEALKLKVKSHLLTITSEPHPEPTIAAQAHSPTDEVAALRAYAERHGQTMAQAYSRMDDPVLAEMDEVTYVAKSQGLTLAAAFSLKGYQ